jgi:hypothetical protein
VRKSLRKTPRVILSVGRLKILLCSGVTVLCISGVRFIGVDNSTYQISPDQIAFFRHAIETAEGPAVLLCHIPLFDAGERLGGKEETHRLKTPRKSTENPQSIVRLFLTRQPCVNVQACRQRCVRVV